MLKIRKIAGALIVLTSLYAADTALAAEPPKSASKPGNKEEVGLESLVQNIDTQVKEITDQLEIDKKYDQYNNQFSQMKKACSEDRYVDAAETYVSLKQHLENETPAKMASLLSSVKEYGVEARNQITSKKSSEYANFRKKLEDAANLQDSTQKLSQYKLIKQEILTAKDKQLYKVDITTFELPKKESALPAAK